MDVRSSRKEFLICGTFKINSIEKMERKREGEREREEDSFLLEVFYIDTKHSYYKSLHHNFHYSEWFFSASFYFKNKNEFLLVMSILYLYFETFQTLLFVKYF